MQRGRIQLVLALASTAALLLSGTATYGEEWPPGPAGDWPTLQRDFAHTGLSPYIGPTTQTIQWSMDVRGDCPPMLGSNGLIYQVVSVDGWRIAKIAAYQLDKTAVFETATMGAYGGCNPTVMDDGTFYYASTVSTDGSGVLRAFRPDGSLKWSKSYRATEVTVAEDGTLWFAEWNGWLKNGTLVAANPETGDAIREWTLNESVAAPALAPDGSLIVASGGFTVEVEAYRLTEPEPLWTFKAPVPDGGYFDRYSVSPPVVTRDGTTYVWTSLVNSVWAVSSDGRAWKQTPRLEGSRAVLALAPDGSIRVATESPARLYSFSADLEEDWHVDLASDPSCRPVRPHLSIDAEGTAFVAYDYASGNSCGEQPLLSAVSKGGTIGWQRQTRSLRGATLARGGALWTVLVDTGQPSRLVAIADAPLDTCTLTCQAEVPSNAVYNVSVPFEATAQAVGCQDTPTFEWDFGDGETSPPSTRPTITHQYFPRPITRFEWALTVRAGATSCRDQGAISLTAIPARIDAPSVLGDDLKEPLAGAGRAFERVAFRAKLQSSLTGSTVRLVVELREEQSEFTGLPDGLIISDRVPSGETAQTAPRYGLVPGRYKWRARADDDTVYWSDWVNGTSFTVAPLPVLFVPGIMGSELVLRTPQGDCEAWLELSHSDGCSPEVLAKNPDATDRYQRLSPHGENEADDEGLFNLVIPMPATSGMPDKKVQPYRSFLEKLTTRQAGPSGLFGVGLARKFPYDWRSSVAEIAHSGKTGSTLRERIQEVLSDTGAPRLDVVAHSMGGLVTFEYLRVAGPDSRIRRIVAVGVPFLGAPEAYRSLRYGKTPTEGFLGVNDAVAKRIAHNSPAAYDLLPSRRFFPHTTGTCDSDGNRDLPSRYIESATAIVGTGVPLAPDTYAETSLFLQRAKEWMNTSVLYAPSADLLLNPSLLARSQSLHDSLDCSVLEAVSGTEVLNLVGWGQPTALRFLEKVEKGGKHYQPQVNLAGDATVPIWSAGWPDAATRYVRLAGDVEHDSLFQDECIQDFSLRHLKDGSSAPAPASCGDRVQQTVPTRDDVGARLIGAEMHSPVELHLFDSQGRHTGPLTQEAFETAVPVSSYTPDAGGHVSHLLFEAAADRELRLIGRSGGTFDLKIHESRGTEPVRTSTFRWVASSPIMRGRVILDWGEDEPVLEMDDNGDGLWDVRLSPLQVFAGAEPRWANIDIRPGSAENPTNLRGLLPVTLLSDHALTGSQVDPGSIRFGRAMVAEAHGRGHWEDVDRDGDLDLTLHFSAGDGGIKNDDTAACLTGVLASGEPFQGCDSIRVVP